jgi:hypothetical protein
MLADTARVCLLHNPAELVVVLPAALLSLQDGVSRIHSSRRVFDAIMSAKPYLLATELLVLTAC